MSSLLLPVGDIGLAESMFFKDRFILIVYEE